jgi:DNA-binding transcriptional regulator YiaG
MHNRAMTKDDLKAARSLLKESQAAFALRFGVHQVTIARWENDGPPERGPARIVIEQFLGSLRQIEAAE